MPVLATTGYKTAEDVLNRIRAIIADSEVAGGDVFTDTAPQSFELLNLGFERVQVELAIVGVETMTAEAWLIGLPSMPISDPEGRMIVDDAGTHITYPNGVGNANYATPFLPDDLVFPLSLSERQTATSCFAVPMKQPNRVLFNMNQQTFLVDWKWQSDGLYFRGALQSQDVKIIYEKSLPKLSAIGDPVPIRNVVNAAAYQAALAFVTGRGGAIAPQFKARADEEILKIQQLSVRRRQRKQVRRRPYSGRGGRSTTYL